MVSIVVKSIRIRNFYRILYHNNILRNEIKNQNIYMLRKDFDILIKFQSGYISNMIRSKS